MTGATILGNKFIFQRGFTLPLTLTLVHMLTQSILAVLTVDVLKAVDKVQISRPDYTRKVLPIAVVFCANIVLGNVSLRFLPVSFMQVRLWFCDLLWCGSLLLSAPAAPLGHTAFRDLGSSSGMSYSVPC